MNLLVPIGRSFRRNENPRSRLFRSSGTGEAQQRALRGPTVGLRSNLQDHSTTQSILAGYHIGAIFFYKADDRPTWLLLQCDD